MCDDQSIETPESEARPWKPPPASMVCHAPGDRCRGCAHYRGEAPVCEHAASDTAPAEMAPVGHIEVGDTSTPAGRLATLIGVALGADHPAMADLAAIVLAASQPATAPVVPAEPVAPMCGGRDYCGRFPFCGCGRPDDLPERDQTKTNQQQGLYRKFEVRRTDGSDKPGGKHYGCEYFVLDTSHDPHAKAALAAYASAVQGTHPELAADLRQRYAIAAAPAAPAMPQPAAQQGEAVAPLNGIKATMFHDEGAIAQCGHCKRYTLDRRALSDRQPACDCGEQHYWSGSFKRPAPDAQWFGAAPPARQAVALTEDQIVMDGLMMTPTARLDSCADAFEEGVRFAERAHGITPAGS